MLRPSTTSAFVVACLLVVSGCDQRKTAEAQFIGTWHGTACIDCTFDFTFYPDHTWVDSGDGIGGYMVTERGRWFLDYKRILIRRDAEREPPLLILNVDDVTPNELKVRDSAGTMMILTRIKTLTREDINRIEAGGAPPRQVYLP
jgi:hypothetical protein